MAIEKSALFVRRDESKQLVWIYPITLSENVIHNDEQLDEKLDTIDQQIAALTPDSSLSSTSTKSVQNKVIYVALEGKVDKEDGKVLSSNDFTDDEKSKLAGIANNANNYIHPSYTQHASGLYKITIDATGHVSAVSNVTKADITKLGIPSENTIYEVFEGASSSADGTSGLVPQPSAGDQNKYLRADGQWMTPETTVDSSLNSSSTNPVQNKVINAAIDSVNARINNLIQDAPEAYDTLKEISDYISTHQDEYNALLAITNNKVDKITGKGLSTNDYTTEEKNKLAGIDPEANNYTHPSYTQRSSGLYKIAVDSTGHVYAVAAVSKSDITDLGIPSENTTYSNMTGANSSTAGKAGLVPAPAAGASNRYLRSDGTWAVPPDTNTTYTLSSFGITATAAEINKLDGLTATTAELNYVDGVTSNIQTQLNSKAATNHTHNQYAGNSKSAIEELLGFTVDMADEEPSSVTEDTYFLSIEDVEIA